VFAALKSALLNNATLNYRRESFVRKGLSPGFSGDALSSTGKVLELAALSILSDPIDTSCPLILYSLVSWIALVSSDPFPRKMCSRCGCARKTIGGTTRPDILGMIRSSPTIYIISPTASVPRAVIESSDPACCVDVKAMGGG